MSFFCAKRNNIGAKIARPRRIPVGKEKNHFGHFSKISAKNENFCGIVSIFFKKRREKIAKIPTLKKFQIPRARIIKIF